jgi:hypothetical protein
MQALKEDSIGAGAPDRALVLVFVIAAVPAAAIVPAVASIVAIAVCRADCCC